MESGANQASKGRSPQRTPEGRNPDLNLDLPKTYLRLTQDLSKTYPRLIQDLPKTYPRPTQDFNRAFTQIGTGKKAIYRYSLDHPIYYVVPTPSLTQPHTLNRSI